jgi:phosphohistidine phosphatase
VKVVHLLRHAKSSWKEPLPDAERPLAPRGRKAAKAMRDYLRKESVRPALVLCSSALRTRETLELIAPALPDVAAWIESDLYGADAQELLARLRGLPGTAPSVLVVGHNPGLHDLAVSLAGGGDAELVSRLREKLPTGALVTLVSAVETWRQLRPGAAELTGYVVPRELS